MNHFIADATRAVLHAITERLPEPRVIRDREGVTKYLSRWYLLGKRYENAVRSKLDDAQVPAGTKTIDLPFNIFLHRFHRSDDDGALHSHPWWWAVSLILVGGYDEERRVVGDDGQTSVVVKRVLPWRLNFLTGDDYHRVDLLEHDAWSLFVVGSKRSTWYFWDRHTDLRAQWDAYVYAKRAHETIAWEPMLDSWLLQLRAAEASGAKIGSSMAAFQATLRDIAALR